MDWRTIDDLPYEVSDTGLIRNIRTGRILKQEDNKGYRRVTLSLGGTTRREQVHRIVCRVFNGDPLEGAECVRHRDGTRTNNVPSNLAWGTHSDNEQDKRRHGTYQERERNPFARLNERSVATIRRRYWQNKHERRTRGFKQVDHGFVQALPAEYGVSVSCIKFVVQRRNWAGEAA